VCWKLEDKNRPGLPDTIIRSPHGRTSWVELKWSSLKTGVAVHLAPTQWQHLHEWQGNVPFPVAFVLVASPAFDKAYLIPVRSLSEAKQTLRPEQLERLPGAKACACSKKAVGLLLKQALT
jgi:hypothetical protein